MGTTFTIGGNTVVTTATTVDNSNVIKRCGAPCESRMTAVTLISGRHVSSMFTRGNHAIMAGATTAINRRMIHSYQAVPAIGCMAKLTFVAATNMIARFTLLHNIVVAALSTAQHRSVLNSYDDIPA